MEINEKKKKKEQQELIIRKYQQYLKLEKSLSPNTLEAYLTDLDKLMSFLTLEGINVLEVCLSDLQQIDVRAINNLYSHRRSPAFLIPLYPKNNISGYKGRKKKWKSTKKTRRRSNKH